MTISLIIHTENEYKLKNILDLIDGHPNKKDFTINLHAKGYVPWVNEGLKNKIISFKSYYAFPTEKEKTESIVELISKIKGERFMIIDEDCESLPIKFWETNPHSLYFKKEDLKYLNLDTKYKSIKWFILDLISQKQKEIIGFTDDSEDYSRYVKKIESPLFYEKIIYIDGGMGDHVMALPLLEKLSSQVYVSCKYPFVYDHIPLKGIIHWNDELFGGYKRFVYEYGSINNSKTIVDAFFEMYDFERESSDILIYKGIRQNNNDVPINQKLALICTSAAKIQNQDSNKDWEDIRWFKLVHELKKKGFFVIQVGTKKDNQIPNVDLKFLDRPLGDLAKLVDDCSLWISVDTFFHHFASAINPNVGICLTPFYNNHAKHPGVKYIEKDCGKNYHDRRWWLDLQQPERKECMRLIQVEDVLKSIRTKRKVHMFSVGGLNDNCSNWRIMQQYSGLDDFEFIHKTVIDISSNDDLFADIVIIQRPILNCLNFVKKLRSNGVKVILDYDDAMPYVYHKDKLFITSIVEVVELLNNCDLITTTNEKLKYYFSLHSDTKCVVLPNIINPIYVNDNKKINEDKIILGWYGSRGHIESVKIIKDVILRVLNEFDNILLYLYTDNIEIYHMLKHEKTIYIPYNFDFLEFQNTLGDIDINLAPLVETYINLHKSNIRIILPGYKKIPSVASNFGDYKELGKDCVLLCDSEDDWYNNLKLLITDKEVYQKYSNNISDKIQSEYSFSSWAENKRNILNSLIDG